MANSNPAVAIYTDGACELNPGPGGWAALLVSGGARCALSGGFRRTKNNRMELVGVIEGLGALVGGGPTGWMGSDSKYVTEAVNQGWLDGWVRNGFRKSKGTRENADLWLQLRELLARHAVMFEWIKGHAAHPENEECDRLAVAARRSPNLPADAGFEDPGGANQSLGLTLL